MSFPNDLYEETKLQYLQSADRDDIVEKLQKKLNCHVIIHCK